MKHLEFSELISFLATFTKYSRCRTNIK